MRRLLLCLLLPLGLPGQTNSWSAEADFNSRYVWRGLTYSRGPVFQPSFGVTRGRMTLSLWSNMALGQEPRRGHFDQLFFSVTGERDRQGWKLEPTLQGYYWQGFSGESNAKTLELSLRASRPAGPLRFFTSHTVDIAGFPGSYIADAGLEGKKRRWGFTWEANGMAAWANATFNRHYVGVERRALNYVQWSVAAIKYSKHGWYVRPHAEFVVVTGAPIRRAVEDSNLLVGGIAIGRGN